MVVASEAEAQKRTAQVTICIVDESGNLLFLEKADGATLNTIVFAQKKARHSAYFRSPSKNAADALKGGNMVFLGLARSIPGARRAFPSKSTAKSSAPSASAARLQKSTKPLAKPDWTPPSELLSKPCDTAY